ncbi:MAG TPA: hypothetical protein VL172_04410 [Kofleriaceae bacterium]|jgi:hypothetical protein|nr:hypothetical protein [Kofleriaceae bacterium]
MQTTPTPSTSTGAGATSADRPSERYYQLERLSMRELEKVFQRGTTPDLDALAGWEFRGTNTPDFTKVLGIKKFIKGFFRRDGELWGYNTPVAQNGIHAPWIARPSETAPKRFGFYRVAPVDPSSRDNHYLHSVLLDYGLGDNPRTDPSQFLRDYVIQVDPDNRDLYLGKAYVAAGPLRVPTSFFIIERFHKGIDEIR